MGRLGIIAGAGELPHIGMAEAISSGEDPIFLSIKESGFLPGEYADRDYPFYITKIGDLFKLCQKNNIDRLVLLGKVNKEIVLKNYKFDLKALAMMAKMLNRNDYSFFKILEEELNKLKIEIISQKVYLRPLLLPEGRYTKKKIDTKILKDIEYGMDFAFKIAEMDLGQTVVVYNHMVMAVEAIEGTDECIKRGGNLSKLKGSVVCKSSRLNQDDRFDLPTIGNQTLQIMKSVNCSAIAIRANDTIVINPKEFIMEAERLKIHFISCTRDSNLQELNQTQKNIHTL